MTTVRIRIEGRVQGVAYRAWTEETARDLDLSGWVRNRADGSVEALFSGEDGAVSRMLARCESGPHGAKVTAVRILEEGGEAPMDFSVLPTA